MLEYSSSDIPMNADPTAPVKQFEPHPETPSSPPGVSPPVPARKTLGSWLRSGWWLLLVTLLPMGAMALPRVWNQPPDEAQTLPALPVQTTLLEPVSHYSVQRTYTGELVARRTSELGFERSGTVTTLAVDEGDWVEVGQVLAQLDTRSLEAQQQELLAQKAQAQARLRELEAGPRSEDITAARAAVADLEQQVELARLQRQRREELYARGAISREELDQQTFGTGSLENRLQQAKSQLDELLAGTRPEQIAAQAAQVNQLDASLQSLAVDLAKSVITAPFEGRIGQRFVDEGVVVSSGQPVVKLIEGGTLEARIGVPLNIADGLTVGSPQTVDLGGQPYLATITALLPELEPTSQTATVVLALEAEAMTAEPSPGNALTIGQMARLSVSETQPAEGFWLPSTALVPAERGLWSLYVLAPSSGQHPDGSLTVDRRDVELIHTQGDQVLVRGLVQAGEQAIVSGIHRIVPGQRVIPTEETSAAEF